MRINSVPRVIFFALKNVVELLLHFINELNTYIFVYHIRRIINNNCDNIKMLCLGFGVREQHEDSRLFRRYDWCT